MNVREIIQTARLDLPTLAQLTGGRIRLPFLKQLSRGAKDANPEHQTALADAFDAHAKELHALARQLRKASR